MSINARILPAYATSSSGRPSSVCVNLGCKVNTWLTKTLTRIYKEEISFNSVAQQQWHLTELLSSPKAVWYLVSLTLPKTPEIHFRRDADNALREYSLNYELLNVKGYVVSVDMVEQEKVIYQLSKETINSLVGYHRDVHCVNAETNTNDLIGKETDCKKLHERFAVEISEFTFETDIFVLDGIEDNDTFELLEGRSEQVKKHIEDFMQSFRCTSQ